VTRSIPPVPTQAEFVDRAGRLTRPAMALLDAIRSAIGGDAARTTPVEATAGFAPVAVTVRPAVELAPVPVSAGRADLAPVPVRSGGGAGGPHTHVIGDVTGLQAALDARQPIGLADPTFWRALAANTAGANGNAAQPWFPALGAVTLPIGAYFFEGQLLLASGTTSHSVGLSFGGTATKSGMWQGRGVKSALGTAATAESTNADTGAIATNRTVTAANTTGACQIYVRGGVRVTAEGTFIPQFQYSAAPGSSLVLANTWFGLWKWADVAATASKGTWT
jgi:hypothetical protein